MGQWLAHQVRPGRHARPKQTLAQAIDTNRCSLPPRRATPPNGYHLQGQHQPPAKQHGVVGRHVFGGVQ